MKTVVAKFGGTSLSDAEQFQKVKAIIESDPSRRYIVASAPGKRFPADVKVTDLLLECYENAAGGQDFGLLLEKIRGRFQKITEDLGEPMRGGFTYGEISRALYSLGFQIDTYYPPEKVQENYFKERADGMRAWENVCLLSATFTNGRTYE